MLVPHLLKIYFGLGWPSSVLEIVSSQRLKTNYVLTQVKKGLFEEKWELYFLEYWAQKYNLRTHVLNPLYPVSHRRIRVFTLWSLARPRRSGGNRFLTGCRSDWLFLFSLFVHDSLLAHVNIFYNLVFLLECSFSSRKRFFWMGSAYYGFFVISYMITKWNEVSQIFLFRLWIPKKFTFPWL